MAMLGELIGTIAAFVPWWLLAIVGGALLVMAAPGYITGLKVKKIKALLRRTTRADETERKALLDQAFAVARGNGDVLIALIKEADKFNHPRARDRALKALRKLGTHPDEVRKLSGPKDPREDKQFSHPIEAAASIRGLIESEAWEAARERLREARKRFGDDTVLDEVERKLVEAAAEPQD